MLQSGKFLCTQNFPRFATTAASTKTAKLPEVISENSADGVKMTCITSPILSNGLSRVIAAFKSGSRHEVNSSDRGLAHLIRRSFGISTEQYTAINITRHLEQMGARVQVSGSREHTVYTVDVAPNLASRAGYFLTHMATAPAYYNWELKDLTYTLMQHDINLLQRRDMPNLCVDLLHEAAFGTHPKGTRLGNSLYSTLDRLGSYSYEQITDFLRKSVMPGKCAITLMNMGNNHQHMDPLKSMDEIKSGLMFHPPSKAEDCSSHDFVGNDIRRDITNSSSTHVMVAYHVRGGRTNLGTHLALAVAAQAIHGGVHNISYADDGSRSSRLAKTAEGTGFEDYLTQCGSIYHSYSDHGLFGYSVVGSCGRATGARVSAISEMFAELANTGLTEEEVQSGKALLKTNLALKSENMGSNGIDVTLQVLETGAFKTFDTLSEEIDALTQESVNQPLKQVLSSGKMAMSVVGANTALTSPLVFLKH